MKFPGLSLALIGTLLISDLAEASLSFPRRQPRHTAAGQKAPYFVLTGDSTVAVDGGWGDGFLSFLKGGAAGLNPAKSGATTVSFRNAGLWDKSLQAVREQKGRYDPIVTVQFGHNDQKAEAGISPDRFQENLEVMAKEAVAAGGTPILVTSLTRRAFSGGRVVQNLETERRRTIAAAMAVGCLYLDLNIASTNYINAIGDANGRRYDWGAGDRTHLNKPAEIIFGRMVIDLLLEKRPDLGGYFRPNETITESIRAGVFVI